MERGDRRGVWALAGHRRQGERQSPALSQLQVAALAFVVVSFTCTLLLLWQPTVCCHQGLNVVSRPLPPQPPTPPTAIFRMQLARPNLAAAKSHLLSRKPHLAACAPPHSRPPPCTRLPHVCFASHCKRRAPCSYPAARVTPHAANQFPLCRRRSLCAAVQQNAR